MTILEHKHLIVRAEVEFQPTSTKDLQNWIEELVETIGMSLAKIPSNPNIWYCDQQGNEGYTGVAVITTSHITIHTWVDNPNLIQLDVYSCKDFDINKVFTHLSKFNVFKLHYKYIDRNKNLKSIE